MFIIKKVTMSSVRIVSVRLPNGKTVYEVAARAVDKNEVKAYRNMLKKRGQ